jgi:hypothetical protein
MSDPAPARTGWVLPVLLAVAIAAASGFAFLYFNQRNAGELGSIRVVVTDDDGKGGSAIRVVVAEAPLAQKETVSPGAMYTGVVRYPAPYLIKPNLKLTSGKRKYDVASETELGFTWVARPLPDDFREGVNKDANLLDKFLGDSLEIASAQGKLKSGLVFEDFTWEAKGLRAPPSALPPKTFQQQGRFFSQIGHESVVFFEVPYDSPPNVELSGVFSSHANTVILEITEKSFKWKNTETAGGRNYGDVTWTAKGIRARTKEK